MEASGAFSEIQKHVRDESVTDSSRADSFVNQRSTSPSPKVQLRPVGHPSPVTLLFEYTVKAWDNQKGDHCTYRYIPSRDPSTHMEMIATVLVRLPNKQPLYVKDVKPRASRVIAQNSVAQIALEKLALEDSELATKLETIKKEQEAAGAQSHNRFSGSPYRNHRAYRGPMATHYYPPQYPPYFVSADGMPTPQVSGQDGEFIPPPPPPMFYPMMPLQSFESDDGVLPSEQLMTPTFGAPYGYGYPPVSPFMPPPEMMYYPTHMMPPVMMTNPEMHQQEEPTTDPTVY
jgi:hypothetical protein